MPATTRLAQLIAQEEGFGIPGAIPTIDNNPGDLTHSPHSSHVGEDPNAIGEIDTVADGWADLERQLQIYAERGLTLEEMVAEYAPDDSNPQDVGNDPSEYLAFVCEGLGLPPTATVSEALAIPATTT
jgi:hypothetical protein